MRGFKTGFTPGWECPLNAPTHGTSPLPTSKVHVPCPHCVHRLPVPSRRPPLHAALLGSSGLHLCPGPCPMLRKGGATYGVPMCACPACRVLYALSGRVLPSLLRGGSCCLHVSDEAMEPRATDWKTTEQRFVPHSCLTGAPVSLRPALLSLSCRPGQLPSSCLATAPDESDFPGEGLGLSISECHWSSFLTVCGRHRLWPEISLWFLESQSMH